MEPIKQVKHNIILPNSGAEKHLKSRHMEYIVVPDFISIVDRVKAGELITIYSYIEDSNDIGAEPTPNKSISVYMFDFKKLKSGVVHFSIDKAVTQPTDWELIYKDLYNSNEAFKYYCDYYRGLSGSSIFSNRLSTFDDLEKFIAWCEGAEYKTRSAGYRKRLDKWYENSVNIQSYMEVLSIPIEYAFCCWHVFDYKNVSGVDTSRVMDFLQSFIDSGESIYHIRDYKRSLKRHGFFDNDTKL